MIKNKCLRFRRLSKKFALFCLFFFPVIGYSQKKATNNGNSVNATLKEKFKRPHDIVQTSVYWYWMCGNISKEGVVKDLEAMKNVGINRAYIGNIYFDPYEGGKNVKLMSDEWWDITHTALKTATKLGIEIGMFNCPGWSQAGGPWVKPNQSMRYLTASEPLRVKGATTISVQLGKPAQDFQDVKVIAYPAPKNELSSLSQSNADITVSPLLNNFENMFNGNTDDGVHLPKGSEFIVSINTKAAFTARSLTVYPTHSNINTEVELQAKAGTTFKSISKFTIDWHNLSNNVGFLPFAPTVISIDETTANEFRLIIKNNHHEGGIAEIELSSSPRIENFAQKTMAKMFQDPLPPGNFYNWRRQPETTDKTLVIDPARVIDITAFMSADGKLNWKAPEGNWIILRTGMVPTGVMNNPGGPDGTGLELDKINKQHVAPHFDAFIGKILNRIPVEDRKTFKVIVQDSYESGGQNFTDNFLAEFKERYGYDALPFLPAYFGKVVGSQLQSDRFLWDMRRLVADKVAYDYVGGFREICHKHGLTTWLENYGHWGFPSEFLMYGGQSDEVGGEFWLPNIYPSWENNLGSIENRAASSSAHIYGKNLVYAESNTSGGPAFSRVPADAKQRTDKYFTEGVNSTLLHVYVHQPDSTRFPGTNAWFGTEFNRTNTWFSHIDNFIDYIKRCNFMLRQGLNVADIAYFIGEDVPKMTGVQDPKLPAGYQFDYINAEVILRDAFVKDGLITLPHGTTYRVLVLPKSETMRPEVLAKIKKLINNGAVVLGPAPTQSPSLQNQPQADAFIKKMAAELWGDVDGQKKTSAKVGKGMLFNGITLDEVFTKINAVPDCNIPHDVPILFGHRKIGKTDIYFVSNQSETPQKVNISFRVKGLQPELYNPITGTTRKLTEFKFDGAVTTVPLSLEGFESAFVVFEKPGLPIANTKNFPDPTKVVPVKSLWNVSFNGKLTNPAPIQLNRLQNFAESEDELIKYFSGNMIYSAAINIDYPDTTKEDVYLDLGEVNKMAKVWVNDQYVGGVWTPPYRVNISGALKQGLNNIRIDVVNTWVNRLIGDKVVVKEKRETWAGMNPYAPDSKLQKTGLLGPVQLKFVPKF